MHILLSKLPSLTTSLVVTVSRTMEESVAKRSIGVCAELRSCSEMLLCLSWDVLGGCHGILSGCLRLSETESLIIRPSGSVSAQNKPVYVGPRLNWMASSFRIRQ